MSTREIPGWFDDVDDALFHGVLAAQARRGNLVELGVYLGRSAVVIGEYLRSGEVFFAVDLFERSDLAPSSEGLAEEIRAYAGVAQEQFSVEYSRAAFEANYSAVHDELPEIVQQPTVAAQKHVPESSARFVHIDASHFYENVREDLLSARQILQADGLVVVDDYRTRHTPGVAAAVWRAVAMDGLIPVCLSPEKFYGVFTPGAAHGAAALIQEVASANALLSVDLHRLGASEVILIKRASPR